MPTDDHSTPGPNTDSAGEEHADRRTDDTDGRAPDTSPADANDTAGSPRPGTPAPERPQSSDTSADDTTSEGADVPVVAEAAVDVGETSGDEMSDGEAAGSRARPGRRVAAWVLTALACLLVLFALVAPDQISSITPGSFVRIPVEGLVGLALLLALPVRPRRVVATVVGVLLGLLTVVKFIDMGFFEALDRPFDPVFDWSFFGPGVSFLTGSIGKVGADAAVIGAAVLAIAVVTLMTLAVVRLSRLAVGHRTGTTRTIAVLAVIWIACALTGVQISPGEPIAARSAAALTYDDVRQVGTDVADEKQFAAESAVDAFRNTPASQLLTGLRGKNVLLTFVESYGRIAVQDSAISKPIDALLDSGTAQLRAAGFDSRSAFLTSSTVGGGSFLAHATMQSGLWVNTQQRYDNLTSGNRMTLTDAFAKAGWRTVSDAPENAGPWPQGAFFGFDKLYDSRNVGYKGPAFSYASMPDQYTMSTLQHNELSKPGHQPVMAEIDLVSSHSPWAPLPRMVGWNDLGNGGAVFDPMPAQGTQPSSLLSKPDEIRTAYGQSIQYSLSALISYVLTYADKNTVLIVLGDHQPAPGITGEGATRDVPITIIAKDPAVLKQISGWGWQEGLRPNPKAPVWRMDTFRDRFLTAFGPQK
jgi:hypothetical protein